MCAVARSSARCAGGGVRGGKIASVRSTSGVSTGLAGSGVELRARDDGFVAELLDARRSIRATRTGAGARVVGGRRFHRSESKRAQSERIYSNNIEQQYESCDEPQETDDRGDCDGCSEHEEQRDGSGGDDDDENRENDGRDDCEAESGDADDERGKMADESKHADRRRVSRRRGSSTNWTRHQLLLAVFSRRLTTI